MNLIKNDQYGRATENNRPTLPSPLLSKLWITFIEHIHRLTLTEDEVLATLSYCFNLPSTMTGQTRILFNSFIAAKLLLPKHNTGTHFNANTTTEPVFNEPTDKDNQSTYVISTLQQDKVNGFLVGFAHCYAASCKPTQPSCYAPTCPHKIYTQWLSIYNNHHQHQRHHILEDKQQDSWTGQVPRHILNTYPLREIKRQSAIAELLQSELDYCKDLALLDHVYAQPFVTSTTNIMETSIRRDKFYAIVFEHALGLKIYHQRICYELVRHRQDPFLLFVDFVGTALLQHTSYLVDPYINYAGRHVQAKYIFDNEKYRNPIFQRWVNTQDEDSRVRKLDIKHFLSRPTFRIAKYKLQLEAIAKYSDHMADQVALYAAIDTLQDLLHQMNESIRKAETHTHLLRITSSLVPSSAAASLGLLPSSTTNDYRDGFTFDGGGPICLLHEGRFRLTKLSSHSLRAQACHVFLFSHALVLTKPRGQPGHEKYVLIGRPIPLPMLSVSTHRSSIMRRLSGRITSQQCHQQRYDHYQLANNISSDNNSNGSSNGSWTTDLRHRFSVTSTTSSSSWSTDSSSSSSSPTCSLSTSPTKKTGITLSEPSMTIDWMNLPITETPTVTGLHVRARLIQRWQHMKRFHQTYPELSTTPDKDHSYNQCQHLHDKKVLLSPMTTSPSFSPFAFTKRKTSLFRSSSSILCRRGSSLFSTKALPLSPSSLKSKSASLSSPIHQQQHQDGKEQQTTGYRGQSRLTIRHLAYPEYTFVLHCRHLHQRDQWFEWIQKALEDSAIKSVSPSPSLAPKSSSSVNTKNGANIKPPFRLGLICQVPVGSTNPININGDRKLPAGCGRIFCSLPFTALDGSQIIALGTQHGLWVAARDGTGEEFQLIEMMECHQMATLNGHLVVRSHRTLKSYSLTQLAVVMKKQQSPDVSSPVSPTSTVSTTGTSGSSAYLFQPSSLSDGNSTSTGLTSVSSTSEESTQTCYPLSISSVTIKRSSVLDFAVGTLYDCPVLCYLGRTRQHLKSHYQKQKTRSSYLGRNFKWIIVLVIYTVKPSKRSGTILSLKKEKVIPLLLEDGMGLTIYNNTVYVRSASRGIECVNVITGQSTLLAGTLKKSQQDEDERHFSDGENQHHWLDMVHLPANIYDDDDLALLCTNQAAWMINTRTLVFEEYHSVFGFEANVKSVALIYPYLILFSNCIIEIRHLEMDEMVQVIPGHNIRCVYMSSPDDTSQRSIIHFTMLHHPDERVASVYQLVL